MILYLSRNESINLLDRIAGEKSLHIRKMSGSFCLSEFIIRDMRKYASCRYFCVERLAITEKDSEFLEALQSFKMMYSARVIVINETDNDVDGFIRGLIQICVTDIVTASDMSEKLGQIAECLSVEGMSRYKPNAVTVDETSEEKETLAKSIIRKETGDEHYRFDCVNVNIGIIGATRRVGTTTLALGLTCFIQNHGGTACYVALNMNRHLDSIAAEYGFDTEEDHYTHDGIDYYECMLPKYDYNFVVFDYGDIKREAVRKFKDSDVHLFCGASSRRYEIMEFAEGLKSIKSVEPLIITLEPNPEYSQLFNSAITEAPIIIKSSNNMLDYKINASVYKEVIREFIVETAKRL